MARKGRARRFREARELKQGFDDGLFAESNRSLADVDFDDSLGDDAAGEIEDSWDEDGWEDDDPLDDDDPLREDDRRAAS